MGILSIETNGIAPLSKFFNMNLKQALSLRLTSPRFVPSLSLSSSLFDVWFFCFFFFHFFLFSKRASSLTPLISFKTFSNVVVWWPTMNDHDRSINRLIFDFDGSILYKVLRHFHSIYYSCKCRLTGGRKEEKREKKRLYEPVTGTQQLQKTFSNVYIRLIQKNKN